jgi:hypothetical protein
VKEEPKVEAIETVYDDLKNGLLGLDGSKETVIYMASVGLLPAKETR